jgi:hypothetical protein
MVPGDGSYRRAMVMRTLDRTTRTATCGLLLITLTGCENTSETTPSSTPPSVPVTTTIPAVATHTLELTTTGTASITSIRYTLDDHLMQEGTVSLPWHAALPIPDDGLTHAWTLDVEYAAGANDSVDLVASYDGQVTARTRSAASGTGDVRSSGGGKIGGSVRG